MGPFNLYYDYRDILRAPRLALSGKKIWILIIGNIAGFITYWVFSYFSLYLAGITIGNAISQYGLYPCLYGNEAEWYSWLFYYLGIIAWVIAILFSFLWFSLTDAIIIILYLILYLGNYFCLALNFGFFLFIM